MATFAEVFNLAWRYHQAGNFPQAEHLYRQILQAAPANPDVWCFLGAACKAQGKLAEAQQCYGRAIQLNPRYAAAHHNLGLALEQAGRREDAVRSYQQALQIEPDLHDARNNLGTVLHGLGKLDEAADCFREVLRRKPDFAEVYANLGNVLMDQGKLAEAERYFHQALRLQPHYAEGYYNLGVLLGKQERFEEAIACYRHAVHLQPNHVAAHFNLANALQEQEKPQEALTAYKAVLQLDPHHVGAHNNMGNALLWEGNLDAGLAHFREAIRLQPENVEAPTNIGRALAAKGQMEQALAAFGEALRLQPDYVPAHMDRSMIWLLVGNFAQGWAEYEWRWRRTDVVPRSFDQPRWDGSDLAGRTLLIHAEQGLGDTLQFIRYAPLVQQRGGTVIFESQKSLMRLLSSASGIDQLVPSGTSLPHFDCYIPLVSLAGVFQTSLDNIPRAIPYLHADDTLVERWRKQLEQYRGYKIGVAWQGSAVSLHERSIPLAKFRPLAQIKGVHLFSLQKGPGTEQIAALAGDVPVVDFGERLDESSGPFMDTAAIMKNMDLIITSDTAVPHLAGALGVPVWVAVPFVPDWRWLLHRDDSPWYPTMRLFRQTRSGRWDDVIERIAAEVTECLGSRAPESPST